MVGLYKFDRPIYICKDMYALILKMPPFLQRWSSGRPIAHEGLTWTFHEYGTFWIFYRLFVVMEGSVGIVE